MKHPNHGVTVVGTGTGVGKTHLAEALLLAAREAGATALGLKPIESGCGSEVSDAQRLAGASYRPPDSAPYRYVEGVSPHLAGRREGRVVSIPRVTEWVRAQAGGRLTLVETAGGLLSPLNETETNLDLALALQPSSLVLVAVDRLGVLHDVNACRLALQREGLSSRWVVLNAANSPDASAGTNAAELRRLFGLNVVELPRGTPSDLVGGLRVVVDDLVGGSAAALA